VNSAGNKSNVFPVLVDTKRLSAPNLPSETKEYPLLLAPTSQEDTDLLTIDPQGDIMPKYPFSYTAKPIGFDSNPASYWGGYWLNGIRVYVSVVVYGLDDTGLKRARKDKYAATVDLLNDIESAIHLKNKKKIVEVVKQLKAKMRGDAKFALAARAACRDFQKLSKCSPFAGAIISQIFDDLMQIEH
jgi:hypothetical protein